MIVAAVLILVLAAMVAGLWVWSVAERRRAEAVKDYLERAEKRGYQVLRVGSESRYKVIAVPPPEPDKERWN